MKTYKWLAVGSTLYRLNPITGETWFMNLDGKWVKVKE